mmetsp:Transcript_6297/g.25560  ORF Transcript_6297/g.25560 Transcript_6297/m.25560 type:complete len:203 (-) Transcript_6297:837-1445(-)
MHRGVSVGVLLKSKRRRHRLLCLCVYGPPMPVPRVFHEGQRPPGDAEDTEPVRLTSTNRIGDVSVRSADLHPLDCCDLRSAPSAIKVEVVNFGLGRAELSLPEGRSRRRDLVDVPGIVNAHCFGGHLNILLVFGCRRGRLDQRIGDRGEGLQRLKDEQTCPSIQSGISHLILCEFWSLPIAHTTRSVLWQAVRQLPLRERGQ